MKTKLIALLLLVALSVSVLAGCAYNYQEEDLTAYATVNEDALYNALQKLSIKDGDFTDGEGENAQIRKDKTLLSFAEAVVSAIKGDTDRQVTEGTVSAGDFITYCYYTVATTGTTKYLLSAEYMQKSKAVELLLMGNEEGSLDAQIESALMGFDLSGLYKESTSGELPTTGWALVSASYNVGTDGAKKTASYMLLDLSCAQNLSDKENKLVAALLAHDKAKIGTKFATGVEDNEETTDVNEADPKITVTDDNNVVTTYYDITISSVITGTRLHSQTDDDATPIAVAPYADEETYTAEELLEVSLKDMYGNTVPVENTTLIEYYVFPVTAYDIEALDDTNKEGAVREILFAIYANSLTITALDVFKSEEYSYKETVDDTEKTVTLTKIISDLIADRANVTKAEEALTAAEKAKTDAQDALDKATDEEKEDKQIAFDAATVAVTKAETALTDAEAKINADDIMAKLAKCVKEDETTAISAIYDAYYDSLYDTLLAEYEDEILENVNVAIGKLLADSVTYTGETPKKAVDEAYDRNMDAYKYDYYEGTEGTDSDAKAYTELYKNLNEFLCKKVAKDISGKEAATVKDAQAVIRTEAEAQVKEMIAIYVLADALNSKYEDANLVLEKSAAEDYATLQAYIYNQQVDAYYEYLSSLIGTTYTAPASAYTTADYYIQYYGENSLRTAYLADLMMAFLTANEEEEDGEKASILDFTNIKYVITEETEAESTED